jgi:hypothetical protein
VLESSCWCHVPYSSEVQQRQRPGVSPDDRARPNDLVTDAQWPPRHVRDQEAVPTTGVTAACDGNDGGGRQALVAPARTDNAATPWLRRVGRQEVVHSDAVVLLDAHVVLVRALHGRPLGCLVDDVGG